MKKVILIFFIVVFYHSSAQIKSGIADYTVIVTENKDSQLEKMMLSMNSNYYSIIKEFEFKLKFNKEKALFSKTEKMYSDNQAANLGSIKIGFLGTMLIKNDSIFTEESSRSIGDFILEKELNKNWILSNETKLIDNNICYKATTEDIVINSKGTFKNQIIAWYCPKIPFPYGPIGFGGLPGLILELQTKDAVYGVKRIQLKENNIVIEELKKYTKIKEKELNDLIDKKNSIKSE